MLPVVVIELHVARRLRTSLRLVHGEPRHLWKLIRLVIVGRNALLNNRRHCTITSSALYRCGTRHVEYTVIMVDTGCSRLVVGKHKVLTRWPSSSCNCSTSEPFVAYLLSIALSSTVLEFRIVMFIRILHQIICIDGTVLQPFSVWWRTCRRRHLLRPCIQLRSSCCVALES